jgi:hypothetical protein
MRAHTGCAAFEQALLIQRGGKDFRTYLLADR